MSDYADFPRLLQEKGFHIPVERFGMSQIWKSVAVN